MSIVTSGTLYMVGYHTSSISSRGLLTEKLGWTGPYDAIGLSQFVSNYLSNPARLDQMSEGTDVSGDSINLANLNANKPDRQDPVYMSEFYAYDHDASVSTNPFSENNISSSGQNGKTITVSHAAHSTWYVSSKPSWVTITAGSTSSGSPSTGSGTISYNVASNSGSSRSGNIVVTLNVGNLFGTHPSGSNSTTTRTTSLNQNAGSGGGPGGGGPPPPGGGGNP